jgi:hypothetical protein
MRIEYEEPEYEETEWKPKFGIDWIHPCALHGGADEGWYTRDEHGNVREPHCPRCGRLLSVESCPWCGANWIKYGGTSWDDTWADAMVTEIGNPCCAGCYDDDFMDGEGDSSYSEGEMWGYDEA